MKRILNGQDIEILQNAFPEKTLIFELDRGLDMYTKSKSAHPYQTTYVIRFNRPDEDTVSIRNVVTYQTEELTR